MVDVGLELEAESSIFTQKNLENLEKSQKNLEKLQKFFLKIPIRVKGPLQFHLDPL